VGHAFDNKQNSILQPIDSAVTGFGTARKSKMRQLAKSFPKPHTLQHLPGHIP
jgi:hypothetical protein